MIPNCDCLEKLNEKLMSKLHKFDKGKKKATYGHIIATMSGCAIMPIKIQLEGQRKCVESFMVALYCPACGKKYIE